MRGTACRRLDDIRIFLSHSRLPLSPLGLSSIAMSQIIEEKQHDQQIEQAGSKEGCGFDVGQPPSSEDGSAQLEDEEPELHCKCP